MGGHIASAIVSNRLLLRAEKQKFSKSLLWMAYQRMDPHRQEADVDIGPQNSWLLVGVGFVALAVSFSVRAVLGLAMPAIGAELDWSRGFLSGVGALALLVMAICAPLAGRAIDIRGPRLLITGGLLAIAAGSAMVAISSSSLVFMLGFGIVGAVGFTAVGTNVLAAAIAQSFQTRRGLATGIGTAGATAGQLLVVPVVAILMQTMSWRYSFMALAMIGIILAVVAYVVLPGRTLVEQSGNPASSEDLSFRANAGIILRAPAFHILFWSFLICGFTTSGVIETHLLPYAAFCGFPPLPSATAYGVLSAVNMAGMALAGYLSDRINRPVFLASIYILRGASFLLLLYIAPDIRLLYLFVVLFGLVDYSTVPITVGLAASHLGVQRIGLAMGLISSGHALGGAAGALLGGLLFDALGNYAWLWTGSMVLSMMAGLLVLTLKDKASNSIEEQTRASPKSRRGRGVIRLYNIIAERFQSHHCAGRTGSLRRRSVGSAYVSMPTHRRNPPPFAQRTSRVPPKPSAMITNATLRWRSMYEMPIFARCRVGSSNASADL
jgi:MFS family permease